MDYNHNTPPPQGGVIHKKAGEPFETDLSDARHDLFRMTCSACFTSRPNHIAWARINKRYMK